MIYLITTNMDAIRKACEDHDVQTLWVFGSAVTGNWVEDKSDVDFLVELDESEMRLSDQYLGLIVDLERALGSHDIAHTTRVEQLDESEFAQSVLRTRKPLNESANQHVAA